MANDYVDRLAKMSSFWCEDDSCPYCELIGHEDFLKMLEGQ